MAPWQGRGGGDLVSKDALITRCLSANEIAACFDPRYYPGHVETIYAASSGRPEHGEAGAEGPAHAHRVAAPASHRGKALASPLRKR